jgi:hypothetical protein
VTRYTSPHLPAGRAATPAARLLVVLTLLTLLAPAALARSEAPLDSDADGLSDRLERRTGTDPYDADSDADGVPDGVEDRNRDGVVDPSESDPRRAGLFPGRPPHIPEPLMFDLVRGLGSRRGELEVNTLALVYADDGQVKWAPEVEWAFADGYAFEIELPMDDRHLEAVKAALQGTLPNLSSTLVHGWQVFAEVGLDDGETDVVLLYLFGQRLGRRLSYLLMTGERLTVGDSGVDADAFLLNASLFWDAREWQTQGLETNLELGDSGAWRLRLLPQIHLQISERLRVQLGAGAELDDGRAAPLLGVRLVLE